MKRRPSLSDAAKASAQQTFRRGQRVAMKTDPAEKGTVDTPGAEVSLVRWDYLKDVAQATSNSNMAPLEDEQ